MKYQLPGLRMLLGLTEVLKENYQGNHPNRLSFIRLLNRVAKLTQKSDNIEREKILFGTCLFELLTIESQYAFLSPSRSQMYGLLIKHLKITTKNSLTSDEYLIYLTNFYHFIQQNTDDELLSNLCWQNKTNLLNAIKQLILVVMNKQTANITHLLEEPPAFYALEKNMRILLDEYRKVLESRWFPNRERLAVLTFLEGINETCQSFYPTSIRQEVHQNDFVYLQADLIRHVRLGLILFALNKINNEYRLLTIKPKTIYGNTLFGSTFFEKGLKAINAKNLHQVDSTVKVMWLRALAMHIKNIKDYHHAIIDKWKDQGFTYLDQFEADINTFLVEQELIIQRPSRTKEYLSMLMSYGAQYGITFTITQLAARATVPAIETAIVGSVSGPIGIVIYGAAGTIIATQLTLLLKEKLIPAALASLYANILTKIGNVIGQTLAGMVTLTFSATTQGLGNLLRFYANIQTEEEFKTNEEWIVALLSLPDDLFPKEKKEIIQHTHDIQEITLKRLIV